MELRFFLLHGLIFIIQTRLSAANPQFDLGLYKSILAFIGEAKVQRARITVSNLNNTIFATKLYNQISKSRSDENVIVSPLSLHTALGMVYLGAEKETAAELVEGLYLKSDDKEAVGKIFAEVLSQHKSAEAEITLANRVYVSASNQIRRSFNDGAKLFFNSEAESINFSNSSDAIRTINGWVEEKTDNKIANILQPGSVDADTSASLVNALYFKGKWKNTFSQHLTSPKPFWISPTKSIEVDTMHNADDSFKYMALPDLDAKAIELPYEESNMSMVIILPNERDGLAKLEEKVTADVFHQLYLLRPKGINIQLPKFRVEFSIGLVDTFKELGIRSIFEDSANLSGLSQSGPIVKISNVQHKAYIDVNEGGSEAVASSYGGIMFTKWYTPSDFIVDHPFVFAIKNTQYIYFVGHVVTF